MKEKHDLIGQRFGRWVVTGYGKPKLQTTGAYKTTWHCMCDCGNERDVLESNLIRGISTSCGCLRSEKCGDRLRELNRTHGGSQTRLFRIWSGIKSRCFDKNEPAYPRYGGRGIVMCQEWKEDFAKFRDWSLSHGYTDELTCDRIDNDKGYSPDNCRWVTMKVQSRNTRRTHYLTINGETLSVADWADRNGIKKDLVYFRLKKGWTPEEAVSTKPNEREERPGRLLVEYNGETHTLATWAKIVGIKRSTLYQRIFLCGWSAERALTEPIDKWKSEKIKKPKLEVDPETKARNKKLIASNKTGYEGVYLKNGKIGAQILVDKKRVYLGTFSTIAEAAKARRDAELKYWGWTKIHLDE